MAMANNKPSRSLPPIPLNEKVPPVPSPIRRIEPPLSPDSHNRPPLQTSTSFSKASPTPRFGGGGGSGIETGAPPAKRAPIVLGDSKRVNSSPKLISTRNDNRSLPTVPTGTVNNVNNNPTASNNEIKNRAPIATPTRRKPATAAPNKDRDLFPVKISLPSGKQAILRCSNDASVESFTTNTIKKLKVFNPKLRIFSLF